MDSVCLKTTKIIDSEKRIPEEEKILPCIVQEKKLAQNFAFSEWERESIRWYNTIFKSIVKDGNIKLREFVWYDGEDLMAAYVCVYGGLIETCSRTNAFDCF